VLETIYASVFMISVVACLFIKSWCSNDPGERCLMGKDTGYTSYASCK